MLQFCDVLSYCLGHNLEKLHQLGVPNHEATCPKTARSVQADEDLRTGLGDAIH